ncbi:fungal-specific transcription factor domain-containing protein [Xylogone sp. PMI_703]|nr:fungal-specific transcription factor domain-containing protein [Xylogone sp. PMI_703]
MSTTAALSVARAENSCRRCHQRKKKCDRLLPQCEACKKARISCSFLDQGDHVGSFPIVYVRGLERRVKELEKQLAMFEISSPKATQSVYPIDQNNMAESEFGIFTQDHGLNLSSLMPIDLETDQASPSTSANGPKDKTVSLAEELELLSLEATAERHLGSSSGVSFAKLTQAVLRRLSPDKSSFVFEDDTEPEPGLETNFMPFSPLDSAGTNDLSFLSLSPQQADSAFPLWEQLGEPESPELAALPPKADATRLTDFYWAHSHTLYPIIYKNEFMKVLWRIYEDPQDPHAQSPLWLFRIWMIFAIGSTAYSSVSLVDESESVIFFNRAMTYFEGALGCGDMAALEALMLQVSYSFFNRIGPNTWFLVGVAARMAIGMGLHAASTYQNLPVNVSEHRKRLFFSLYMMDRVVSLALGRPFAMRDDDIDVEPFADADDENIKPDKIIPQDPLQPSSISVPLHILALRKIASEIGERVYSTNKTRNLLPEQRDQIIQDIHKKLIEWRRNMPFPLPDSQSRVPHMITSWFDLNYYTHVTMLYRPSPLFPTLDIMKVKILAEASAMSIRQATNMHHQQRFAYNWLNLFGVFTSSLALMYAITAQPDLMSVLNQTDALRDLELAMELLGTFGKKFASARKCQSMVREVLCQLRTHAAPK